MRHLKSGRKLSRRINHRKAMLANLAVSLIKNEKIKTTDAKAKEIRPFVEKMVTFAKRGDLHARRIVLSHIKDADAVKKLFDEIGPQYVDRLGGYTRIVKLGFRHGDNSPISLIEFVKEEAEKKPAKKRKTSKTQQKVKPEKTPDTQVEADKIAEPETKKVKKDEPDKPIEVEAVDSSEVKEVEAAEEVKEAAEPDKIAVDEEKADDIEIPAEGKEDSKEEGK